MPWKSSRWSVTSWSRSSCPNSRGRCAIAHWWRSTWSGSSVANPVTELPRCLRERDRLCNLLEVGSEDLVPGSLPDQVEDLNQQLVSELERPDVSVEFETAAREALMAITKEKLAIVRPGYDGHSAEEEAR
ncbi:MAG: hypothetical protein U5R48_15375 [Gammaproteobacteria bacterium]|nr:hypothetical protein [Gammaproteobacteria bacterium]